MFTPIKTFAGSTLSQHVLNCLFIRFWKRPRQRKQIEQARAQGKRKVASKSLGRGSKHKPEPREGHLQRKKRASKWAGKAQLGRNNQWKRAKALSEQPPKASLRL